MTDPRPAEVEAPAPGRDRRIRLPGRGAPLDLTHAGDPVNRSARRDRRQIVEGGARNMERSLVVGKHARR